MSFLVIIISITVMGFTSVTSSQERIIDAIGGNYAEALHVTIVDIDDTFKDNVFGLLSSSNRSFVTDFIINSNMQSDVPVDKNGLSLKLQETSNSLESKFGYPIYEDVSVADSTGTVYGTSLEAISGLVEITFTRPTGEIEELTTILTKDGKFSTILVESWISGDYTLHASYDGNTISELNFFIGDKSSTNSSASTAQCQDANCVSVDSEDKILSSPIMIMIDGDFENVDSDIPIDVKIIRPDNTSVELSTVLSASGEFESPLVHSEEWISGVYTVIVSYHGDQLSAASFRK